MQLSQRNLFRHFVCLALLTVIWAPPSSTQAQDLIPNLSFSGKGNTHGYQNIGVATASSGAWRGDVEFGFSGRINNGQMRMDGGIQLPEARRSNGKLWRVRAIDYNGTINQQGKPQVVFNPADPTFNILTISNLPGVEDFYRNSHCRWNGVLKVTLKFSKINGVADSFGVAFTPTSRECSTTLTAVSGTIANARVKAGSNLELTLLN